VSYNESPKEKSRLPILPQRATTCRPVTGIRFGRLLFRPLPFLPYYLSRRWPTRRINGRGRCERGRIRPRWGRGDQTVRVVYCAARRDSERKDRPVMTIFRQRVTLITNGAMIRGCCYGEEAVIRRRRRLAVTNLWTSARVHVWARAHFSSCQPENRRAVSRGYARPVSLHNNRTFAATKGSRRRRKLRSRGVLSRDAPP